MDYGRRVIWAHYEVCVSVVLVNKFFKLCLFFIACQYDLKDTRRDSPPDFGIAGQLDGLEGHDHQLSTPVIYSSPSNLPRKLTSLFSRSRINSPDLCHQTKTPSGMARVT